jgi:hypothetical protein
MQDGKLTFAGPEGLVLRWRRHAILSKICTTKRRLSARNGHGAASQRIRDAVQKKREVMMTPESVSRPASESRTYFGVSG